MVDKFSTGWIYLSGSNSDPSGSDPVVRGCGRGAGWRWWGGAEACARTRREHAQHTRRLRAAGTAAAAPPQAGASGQKTTLCNIDSR